MLGLLRSFLPLFNKSVNCVIGMLLLDHVLAQLKLLNAATALAQDAEGVRVHILVVRGNRPNIEILLASEDRKNILAKSVLRNLLVDEIVRLLHDIHRDVGVLLLLNVMLLSLRRVRILSLQGQRLRNVLSLLYRQVTPM